MSAINTGDQETTITITYTYDDEIVDQRVVGPNSSAAIILPKISALVNASDTSIVRGGAFRLRATAPVTVYQYSPLQIATSNDASLLLPTNTWTAHYRVISRQHWAAGQHGMFAVVAREDGTTVTIVPPGEGALTDPGAGIDDLGHGVVLLDEGDVLQVLTRWIWDGDVEVPGDLTGAQVLADKPVQVIAGHECTAVPSDSFACDHLEESMLPFEALGREYVVVSPVQWPETALPKAVFVRVVAAEDGATLTFEPDQAVPKFLTKQGDFIEIGPTTDAFVVASDRKIVVAEYMVSHEFGYGTSDPSMVLAVPREQLRSEYIVYAHPTWLANFISIVAPVGSMIDVDGEPVLALEPIGASGLGFAHIELSNSGDGAHRVTGDEPFGISVYGVGEYGSYWYPGGLNVELIPPG